MARSSSRGVTLLELLCVLGLLAALAAIGWPVLSEVLLHARLNTAARHVLMDIRSARERARATGRVFVLQFDPAAGRYTVGPSGTAALTVSLPSGVGFGLPDDPGSDGITFRDNTVWVYPYASLSNSFGSIAMIVRGHARKITLNIAGDATVTTWTGQTWR